MTTIMEHADASRVGDITAIEPQKLNFTTDTGHRVYWQEAEVGNILHAGNEAVGEHNIVSCTNAQGHVLVALNVDDEGYDEAYSDGGWGRDAQGDLSLIGDLEAVTRAIAVLTTVRDGLQAVSR